MELRRLAAILAADIAGYSTLMGADEARTVRDLKGHQAVLLPMIGTFGGRIIDTAGDGILAEFGSVMNAVECAVAIQREMAARNAKIEQKRRLQFRIGINLGDVIYDAARIYGDGINIAARLEAIADPGGICISNKVYEDIRGKLAFTYEDLGDQQLKNISQPVRAYRLGLPEKRRASANLTLPSKPSIAVLPFMNMSGDHEQQYFADGIVGDITRALSRVKWLFVIARSSSSAYEARPIDVKQVGRELGVRYLLEGSVRKAANRVRLTAQLLDATTGHHMWAERYDRELADIFAVQDEITDQVMAAIEPQLYAAEGDRARRKRPENLDAWECMVRAISLINARTRLDGAAARRLLQKATELDPGYAQAHSLLAFVLSLSVLSGWEPRDPTLALATQTAQRALGLDGDDPWSHAAAGFALVLDRRVEDSVVEYKRALALNPSFAYGHTMLGAAFCYLGRCDEAMAQIDKAERLSPRDLLTHGNHGANNVLRAAACMVADRYREGITFARIALAENPSSTPGRRQLVINCALAGEIKEASSALQIVKRLQPNISLKWIEEWVPFVRAEDRRKYVEGFRLAGID